MIARSNLREPLMVERRVAGWTQRALQMRSGPLGTLLYEGQRKLLRRIGKRPRPVHLHGLQRPWPSAPLGLIGQLSQLADSALVQIGRESAYSCKLRGCARGVVDGLRPEPA
ncbi:hypothetical protein GCM10018962_36140 [Dactylosporangium matsuzakiense]|uniref:Uncharacterized protein n=1 Tax=Dactylosporangium matsuzakiense TaxID=53360 RepID=A0A9W6NPW6_9ACTN|nr:hypothetical protein GCM10017581_064850 [Dactylosporangium matsuzakiense]